MFEEKIAAGMAELDKRIPEWRSLIDVSTLDMALPCLCIGGQIGEALGVGNFYDMCHKYGWSVTVDWWDDAETDTERFAFETLTHYDILTAEWITALTAPVVPATQKYSIWVSGETSSVVEMDLTPEGAKAILALADKINEEAVRFIRLNVTPPTISVDKVGQ